MYTNCNNLSIVILNMNSLLYLSTAVVDSIYSIYSIFFFYFFKYFFSNQIERPKEGSIFSKGTRRVPTVSKSGMYFPI